MAAHRSAMASGSVMRFTKVSSKPMRKCRRSKSPVGAKAMTRLFSLSTWATRSR